VNFVPIACCVETHEGRHDQMPGRRASTCGVR
jgi:hypothetical protein